MAVLRDSDARDNLRVNNIKVAGDLTRRQARNVSDARKQGKLAYYKALLHKYRGRGFPLRDGFDLTLVVKQMKKATEGGSSSSSAEVIFLVTALQADAHVLDCP